MAESAITSVVDAMRQAASFHEKVPGPEIRLELREVLHEVSAMAAKLKLSREIRRRAVDLVTEARLAGFGRKIPRGVLAAAAIYVACRETKTTVTLREIADSGGSDPRDVGRCYLSLLQNMHISRPNLNGRDYVSHLALKRPVSEQVRRKSQDIILRLSANGLGGRNPMTLAAAAVYIACCDLGENLTQSEAAEAAGVGEESVRECCKIIRLSLGSSPWGEGGR